MFDPLMAEGKNFSPGHVVTSLALKKEHQAIKCKYISQEIVSRASWT
jgi:hypothetical protein